MDTRRYGAGCLMVLGLLLLSGCGGGVVHALTMGTLYSDTDDCKSMPERQPPQLDQYLTSLEAELATGKTGVHVLEDGAGALMARQWLTTNAARSIDIQYFIFSSDALGLIAADEVLRAAERGVKVRLLVDDLLHDGDAEFLLALDAHPNLEIRVYNPNINIGKSLAGQLLSAAKDFRGVNQRMHNKTFIVDDQVVITGGRNIADEYFDFSLTYNFRDRDVLLIGGAVSQVRSSFSEFWTDPLSVPLERILGGGDVPDGTVWTQLHRFACRPDNYWPEVRARAQRVPERFAELRSEGRLRWIDGVRFVSDDPGKNDGTSGLKGGGKTTDVLIALVKDAKREVVIQSPYLVTTELSQGLFRAAINRGVRVRILTNSLASTDSFPAFSGYVRDREKLLAMGVEIYEFKPDAPVARSRMTSALMKKLPKLPVFGLHAKSMVIDQETVMVGTFNLDPRSANLNTECVVIFKDVPLAMGVLELLEEEMAPENSWRTTLEENPDEHAPFSHKWKLFWARPVPKGIL